MMWIVVEAPVPPHPVHYHRAYRGERCDETGVEPGQVYLSPAPALLDAERLGEGFGIAVVKGTERED